MKSNRTINTNQLTFFREVGTTTLKIEVHRDGDETNCFYRANIAGGWWTATGKTSELAVRNVVIHFQDEVSQLRLMPV